MVEPSPNQPDFEPLTRTQILIVMGVTAVLLLFAAKLWLYFDPVALLPLTWSTSGALLGVGLGVGITVASSVIYQLWPSYRQSANYYLQLVLKPLLWPDMIWLGLLPGLSEELLFRGVILSALGFNSSGLLASSLCFGALHFTGLRQWSYVAWATAVGLVLGASAIATGNLLVPIVAHIVTNLISSSIWKLKNRSPSLTN